jgi:uncharacterized membrane protein
VSRLKNWIGVYSLGFSAGPGRRELERRAGERMWHIFIPCTPNPTTGYYVLAPEKDLVFLRVSVEEAFKLIISDGLIAPGADNHSSPDSASLQPAI